MIGKSNKFQWFVRLGYFSRAVLYILLGAIALTSREKIEQGPEAAFTSAGSLPGGAALLWILALGMLSYALFRFASAFFDVENYGTDKEGIFNRIGHAGSGIGHLVLAYSAYGLASGGSSGGGDEAENAAAGLISMDVGAIILGVLGLAFVLAGIMQARKGITGSFMQRISPQAPHYTRNLGGFGFVTRAIVFVIIGWSLIQSAWFNQSSEVKTLGEAIASLGDEGILFTLVAVGLVLFGIFSLILTRFRIVPDLNRKVYGRLSFE